MSCHSICGEEFERTSRRSRRWLSHQIRSWSVVRWGLVRLSTGAKTVGQSPGSSSDNGISSFYKSCGGRLPLLEMSLVQNSVRSGRKFGATSPLKFTETGQACTIVAARVQDCSEPQKLQQRVSRGRHTVERLCLMVEGIIKGSGVAYSSTCSVRSC
jgi:hypothetical protein